MELFREIAQCILEGQSLLLTAQDVLALWSVIDLGVVWLGFRQVGRNSLQNFLLPASLMMVGVVHCI